MTIITEPAVATGLVDLDLTELRGIDGGGIWDTFVKKIVEAIATEAGKCLVNNLDKLVDGFESGWTDASM